MENARTLSLLVALFVACAGSPSAPEKPWSLEVTSSGGIAGRGSGSMRVDSAGSVSVTKLSGKRCADRLSDEESRQLGAAVANARPEAWPTFEPVCCDRIEWTLVLDQGGKKHTVTWIDDPKVEMPADLRALTKVLAEIRSEHMEKCR